MSGELILIVEDDESILAGLRLNLELEGFRVAVGRTGKEGLELHAAQSPDLILLDLMLPEVDGFEVLDSIRRKDVDVPIVVITARGMQTDKINGLNGGADDYVTKPFALPELLARINAALRRARVKLGPSPNLIAFGDVRIDVDRRTVTKGDAPVELTRLELDLLLFLARSRERVLTRDQILRRVWTDDYEGTERTVDNFVRRLRQKLEDDPENPRHVQTVRGVGYRFVP